jgi:hypothetical protein
MRAVRLGLPIVEEAGDAPIGVPLGFPVRDGDRREGDHQGGGLADPKLLDLESILAVLEGGGADQGWPLAVRSDPLVGPDDARGLGHDRGPEQDEGQPVAG